MHSHRHHTIAALLVILVVSIADSVRSEARERPNILMIVSEDNGPELGCYGDPYARTPHLDRLAAQGVRFNRAFVTQAGCSQSRASILTGLYPHQHGQIGLATWGFRMYRPDTPNLVRTPQINSDLTPHQGPVQPTGLDEFSGYAAPVKLHGPGRQHDPQTIHTRVAHQQVFPKRQAVAQRPIR